jgi:hypothetical protein
MNVAILGRFGNRPLAPGWTKETTFAALGGAELDISDAPPGERARLTVIVIFGGVKILVAPGTRVRMHGFSLLGGREARVAAGDGPDVTITAVAIFGSVRIKEEVAETSGDPLDAERSDQTDPIDNVSVTIGSGSRLRGGSKTGLAGRSSTRHST